MKKTKKMTSGKAMRKMMTKDERSKVVEEEKLNIDFGDEDD